MAYRLAMAMAGACDSGNAEINAEEFLQRCYTGALVAPARVVADLPNVCGFGVMNEPSPGFIGTTAALMQSTEFAKLQSGFTPTPLQAMALGDDRPDRFIAAVERLLDDIAIPASLAEIDVPFDCAARIADKALLDSAAATNPKAADAAEIQRMVETAIKKAR